MQTGAFSPSLCTIMQRGDWKLFGMLLNRMQEARSKVGEKVIYHSNFTPTSVRCSDSINWRSRASPGDIQQWEGRDGCALIGCGDGAHGLNIASQWWQMRQHPQAEEKKAFHDFCLVMHTKHSRTKIRKINSHFSHTKILAIRQKKKLFFLFLVELRL